MGLGLPPLLAVHISDGVLTWPWLLGGFVLAGLLTGASMYKVRDEEIPRIALMTAAFFVASLIHVPIGPTSVHLLLNGLLGVVLGRRAPLAVLLGLTLQAVLLGHGGFTAVGVNTCVMALPALGAAWLFRRLRAGTRHAWFRGGLVVVSVLAWTLCLSYTVVLFWLGRSARLDDGSFAAAALAALPVAFQPAVLLAAGALAAAAAWLERRAGHASEFPAGLVVGLASVLATLTLAAIALLFGSVEDWHTTVLALFIAHMPIAVAEGVILGFAVGFLARVKPEMLGGLPGTVASAEKPLTPAGLPSSPSALLLALLVVLWAAAPAQAHRLDAGYTVRPDGQIQVESWFDIGGKAPAGAKVQVFHADGTSLTEGSLDDQGIFVFAPKGAEDLKVVVSAGAGHRAEFPIPRERLTQASAPDAPAPPTGAGSPPTPLMEHNAPFPYKEVLTGFAFLLALAAFVLGLRNMRQLRELKRLQEAARCEPEAREKSIPTRSASEG